MTVPRQPHCDPAASRIRGFFARLIQILRGRLEAYKGASPDHNPDSVKKTLVALLLRHHRQVRSRTRQERDSTLTLKLIHCPHPGGLRHKNASPFAAETAAPQSAARPVHFTLTAVSRRPAHDRPADQVKKSPRMMSLLRCAPRRIWGLFGHAGFDLMISIMGTLEDYSVRALEQNCGRDQTLIGRPVNFERPDSFRPLRPLAPRFPRRGGCATSRTIRIACS